MMGLTPRCFRGEEDAPKIKEFLKGRRYWDALPDYWNTGKSTYAIYLIISSSAPSNSIVWEDENGQVQAYTWLSFEENHRIGGQSRSWRILIHADHNRGTVAEDMLLHAEYQLAAQALSDDNDPLKTVAYETDDGLLSLIRAHGYVQEDHLDVYMRQSLDREIPEPEVVDGYVVRELRREGEIGQRAGAQSESFGGPADPDERSVDEVTQKMRWNEGTEDIDLVAVSSSGTVASYAACSIDPVTKLGEFDPVGTRPAHRRRGLSRAVMLTGLRYMKDKGMAHAVVRTDFDNYPAIRLYESVGFEVVDNLYRYIKKI